MLTASAPFPIISQHHLTIKPYTDITKGQTNFMMLLIKRFRLNNVISTHVPFCKSYGYSNISNIWSYWQENLLYNYNTCSTRMVWKAGWFSSRDTPSRCFESVDNTWQLDLLFSCSQTLHQRTGEIHFKLSPKILQDLQSNIMDHWKQYLILFKNNRIFMIYHYLMKENSTVYNIMCVHIYEHRIPLIQYYRTGHMPENQIFGIS
jgi:hypothetical protein